MATSNDIPKNMGKKIAEALRNQDAEATSFDSLSMEEMRDLISLDSEEDVMPKAEQEEPLSVRAQIKSADDIAENGLINTSIVDDLNKRELGFDIPAIEEERKEPVIKVNKNDINADSDMTLSFEEEEEDDDVEEFEMPNNINVLKKLIAQLPAGVPKTTGAIIIRQTIEALGIPMKSVLQDAQKVRELLNSSIKDCAFTIQEYKSNIKNLEKQSKGYQKQLAKLNDIIGLFIYSDKK